ncbi:hypothetical protein AMATHDRAFT_72161 [Amanita thiersii Skay4041]|uniref:Thioredoxin domain-containing protein n=1 Tax=Amanita thiersii Skay4041 TaxID=703135 RepID=A0A2A9N7R3_9AGAR|nr:hypothetical protein AMATHDRAFT_72161 [Amanita thiersii Skay4041]
MALILSLSRLPTSLILTSLLALTLACFNVARIAAVPLDSSSQNLELTPEDFKEKTSTGYWLVEHFSPFCPHCVQFAPTWKQLVKDAETEFPFVHLAQVDCSVHGDLCTDNGANSFPQINLFHAGQTVQVYKGSRDLSDLKNFLHLQIPDPNTHTSPDQAQKDDSKFKLEETSVTLVELTPDNFEKSTATGIWFIEHFSPYCPHCRRFAPKWEQLVKEGKAEFPHVNFAQVNCAVHGDLCKENGVTGYPQMNLFISGKNTEEYRGSRDLNDIKDFLTKRTSKSNVPGQDTSAKDNTDSNAGTNRESQQEESDSWQDPRLPKLNLKGEVVSLTPENFVQTLEKGPAFVKFFAPWCGHCKKLAPTWAQMAKRLQGGHTTIAEVNCDDHRNLCTAQNIKGYPTLIYFANGKKSEYNSGRKLDQMIAFVEQASAPPLRRLKNTDELQLMMDQHEVVYLLLMHSRVDQNLLDAMKDASASLLGQPPILFSTSPDLFQRYKLPESPSTPWALISLKHRNAYNPSSIFLSSHLTHSENPLIQAGDASAVSEMIRDPKSQLATWLRTHRLPTWIELTQDTFQQVMNAPEEPLVLIAAVPPALKGKAEERLRDWAGIWRSVTGGAGRVKLSSKGKKKLWKGETVRMEAGEREVVFTWMDAVRWKDWMKSMYGVETKEDVDSLDRVRVVIADHKRLIYWDADKEGRQIKLADHRKAFSVIQNAAKGLIEYKHSENRVERLARYINSAFIALEQYITEHPLNAVFIVVVTMIGVVCVIVKMVGGSAAVPGGEYRKIERLD